VPSSISSSNDRVPEAAGRRIVILAVILFVIAFSTHELFWRAQGHKPSVVDDRILWAHHRDDLLENKSKTVVLLGASRMQLGFSTETFRERFPDWSVLQLAITGRGPIAALKDLADEEQFAGVVICSITAADLGPDTWEDQQSYVDYYHRDYKVSINTKANRYIGSLVQRNLVGVSHSTSSMRVLGYLLQGRGAARPSLVTTCDDRSRSADYTLVNAAASRRSRVDSVRKKFQSRSQPIPQEWLKSLAAIKQMVEDIQSRGGRVIFVRFPTTGEHLRITEQFMPKNAFWDRLAQYTTGHTIHFLDFAEHETFECPDASHIDQRDKQRFTNALLDEVVRKGTFAGVD
jgi:hypothetical protein